MKNPLVDEIRKNRLLHTQKFGGDLAAICADLRSIQTTSGHTVVKLHPKKLHTSKRQQAAKVKQ